MNPDFLNCKADSSPSELPGKPPPPAIVPLIHAHLLEFKLCQSRENLSTYNDTQSTAAKKKKKCRVIEWMDKCEIFWRTRGLSFDSLKTEKVLLDVVMSVDKGTMTSQGYPAPGIHWPTWTVWDMSDVCVIHKILEGQVHRNLVIFLMQFPQRR